MSLTAAASPPFVALDERTHVYTHRDGHRLPGVTTILGSVPPWLGRFDRAQAEAVDYKRERGEQIHRATQYFDEGVLDEASVDPTVAPGLRAWQRFRTEKRFEPLEIETLVWHPIYGYAGKLDRIGLADTERGRGLVLGDIKTGDASMAGPQTAAYLEAWVGLIRAGLTPQPPWFTPAVDRWTIQLHADGHYTLTPHRSRRDFRVFLAAFELYTYARQPGAR